MMGMNDRVWCTKLATRARAHTLEIEASKSQCLTEFDITQRE